MFNDILKIFSILFILLIFSGCKSSINTKVNFDDFERAKYITELEEKINKKTNSDYGKVILKYDLLELDSDQNFCGESALYKKLSDNKSGKRKFIRKIKFLEKKILIKSSSSSLIELALKNMNKKISYFSSLAKKLNIVKDQSFESLDNNKLTKDVFAVVDNIDNKKKDYLIDKLEFIKKYLSSAPIYNPMEKAIITSKFGIRKNPVNNKKIFHKGIDLKSDEKRSKIFSTAEGKVIFAGNKTGYGKLVIIDHGNFYQTYYAHLSSIKVKVNDYVLSKQIIGIEGSTGKSTNEHLHYEIRFKDQPLDPSKFFAVSSEKICNNNDF